MKLKTILLALALSALGAMPGAAQGYTIYPVPQQQAAGEGSGTLSRTQYELICEAGIDAATRARLISVLEQSGRTAVAQADIKAEASAAAVSRIYVGINGSGGAADQKVTALGLARDVFTKSEKYDRHLVAIAPSAEATGAADVVILGENTDAAFYGLASLEQMLEQQGEGDEPTLAYATLYDYADQQSRGIVEGYYGYPYTIAVKKDLMRFMMRYKMNTYMYGAKSDPYHSQMWQTPYPTTITDEQAKNGWLTQDMLRDLTSQAAATKVNFIWAIHPGNAFTDGGNANVMRQVEEKFDNMYQLGIRQFAVFIDDVGVPNEQGQTILASRLTQLQGDLEARYNGADAAPEARVKPLHFVPHIYCVGFANAATRKSYFNKLGTIPEEITVYITGGGVWSVPNDADLQTIQNDFGRRLAWWWNYPCNDNADGQLYPMDMYSNFYDMPAVDGNAKLPAALTKAQGLACNPMQQGEVSKIPIFSVADYAWNNGAFNNLQSWQASFPAIVGKDKAAAYQLLAQYLRYNDPEELGTLLGQFKTQMKSGKPAVSAELEEKMNEVLSAVATLETLEAGSESDRLLLNDLSPWLKKLKAMCGIVKELIAAAAEEGDARWEKYVAQLQPIEALNTAEEFKAYALEGMGNEISVSVRPAQPAHKHLYPFINYVKEHLMDGFFQNNAQEEPAVFSNLEKPKGRIVTLSSGQIHISLAVNTLGQGDYYGIAMPAPTKFKDIALADTLVANNRVVYSENGRNWKRFATKEEMQNSYVRYIAVINESETPKSIDLRKGAMLLTPFPAPERKSVTAPTGNIWGECVAGNLIDGNLQSMVMLGRGQQKDDCYTIALKNPALISGARLYFGTENSDYARKGVVEISPNNVFWIAMPVKGTATTGITYDMPQVKSYAQNICYVDLVNTVRPDSEIKSVRFRVDEADGSKWLRLFELEVNPAQTNAPAVVDGAGFPLNEANDALAYTAAEPTDGAVVYHLYNALPAAAVDFYVDPATLPADAALEVTLDGETWQTVCALTQAHQGIDLTAYPKAQAVRITWSGDKAPRVYEVKESADPDGEITVTKISSLPAAMLQAQRNFTVTTLDGRTLRSATTMEGAKDGLSKGLYIIGGRKVYVQ